MSEEKKEQQYVTEAGIQFNLVGLRAMTKAAFVKAYEHVQNFDAGAFHAKYLKPSPVLEKED